VNFSFGFSLAVCRTRSQPGGHAGPARCPVPASLVRVPLGPCPWLHRLRGRLPARVRRLPSYYGRARLLPPVHHRVRPSGLPDADRLAQGRTARRETSRFPRNEPRRMLGSSTTRGRPVTRLTCRAVLPSAHATASAPRTSELSRLNTQPTPSPVNASTHASRRAPHDSGSVWIATPSPRWTCTTYSLPVSRRTACFETRPSPDGRAPRAGVPGIAGTLLTVR
jgi:hypothetical protein